MTRAFAAWSRNADILRESTSGGVFSELALPILRKGGIVVGAAYGDGLRVEHRIARTEDELAALRGVKYVHGEISKEVYFSVRSALENGKDVLFSGLPCQCAAIRKMFGDHPHLLVVDLICFGAPPQKLWLKYVSWLERKHGKRLVNINPRDKKHGWGRKTYYRYDWEDGSSTIKMSLFDPYSQAFYSGIAFCGCCYRCQFKGANHKSDITLGDFRGADRLDLPNSILKKGISAVVCHSDVGVANLLPASLELMTTDTDTIIENNPPYATSAKGHPNYAKFVRDMPSLDFEELVAKYRLQIRYLDYCRSRLGYLVRKLLSKIK